MRPSLPLIFLSIERRLVILGCQHKINTPLIYQVQDKTTRWFTNSRRPITHESPTTPEYITASTYKLKKSSTHKLTTQTTPEYINSSTYRLINSQTQKNRQPINLSAHKHTSSKLINLQTHQLKKLKLSFLFYNTTLIFTPF